MLINNVGEMNAHFLARHPEEGCGIVVNEQFIPIENIAEEPELDFRMRKGDYFYHDQKSGVQAVVHSHIITTGVQGFDKRAPSMADMAGQKAGNVPWGIVTTDGEHVSTPLWFGLKVPAPIEGRIYVHNVYDCLTLIGDYLKLEFDIRVPSFPRPMNWDGYNKNMIVENIENAGFTVLPRETKYDELHKGDVVLFKIQSNYVNHCGVIADDGMFWHQLQGRITKKDHLGRWEKQIAMYTRHKDLA